MATFDPTIPRRNYNTWRACVWAGWIFLVGFLISWGILGFNLPTLEPSISQSDLYAHYQEHNVRIRIAMVLTAAFMPFYFVMSAVISRVMQRIEGPDGPLAIVEQMGGAVTVVVGQIAPIAWLVGAFRFDERSPEIVRVFYDFGWLYFDTTYMVTTLQMLSMAFVFLSDKRTIPLFPKWVSWLSIFVAMTFLMLSLLPFFLTGPFAWNGLFNYWVGLGGFFVWTLVMLIYLSKVIDRLEREEP